MRISDWSSDVCSSDLEAQIASRILVQTKPPIDVAEAITTNEGVYDLLASREKHCALDCGAAGYPITARLAAEIIGVFASEAMEAILPTLALRVRAVELHDRSEEHTSELQSLMRSSY